MAKKVVVKPEVLEKAPKVVQEEQSKSPKEAPDNIPAWAGDAFKSVTFDHKVWFVYAKDGRRLTGPMTEDETIRLVRGFGVK